MSLDIQETKQDKLILLPEYDYNNPNNHDQVICDFILKETLGKGTFGVVKLAVNGQTGEKVAIKIINETKLPKEEKLNFLREIEILQNLKHPNIIRLYSHINKEKQLYLITEYIKGIELFQYISLKKKIPESEACLYFQQIISSLEYLHKMGIVHRDIKPENILVDHHLKEIKIIDFGLSNKYTKNSNLLSTRCGSPLYAAPEVLQGRGYKPAPVDIWSCGVVLYFMLCGKLPFQGDSDEDLYKKIIDAKIKNIDGVSKEANDLVKNILNPNARKRITITKIKKHPWFNLFNNNFIHYNYYGLLTNKYVMPIDEEIVSEIKNRFNISEEEIRTSILGNKLNDISTIYYLIVIQKSKENNISISDFKSDIFINYIKDKTNLLRNYSNDINKVIKLRKKGIEFENQIKLERSNFKNIKGIHLEKVNLDDKKDLYRSLSPTTKNSKYDLINNNSNCYSNNTRLKSPETLKSLENSKFLNTNSNMKYKGIDTEVDSIKNKGLGKYKKLFVKSNTNINKLNLNKNFMKNFPKNKKIGKYASNNNYNKCQSDYNKTKNCNRCINNLSYNNLSSEKKPEVEEKYKKTEKKSENISKNKNLSSNGSKNKNIPHKNTNKSERKNLLSLNDYIKNSNNEKEKEKNMVSLTVENKSFPLQIIKESLHKLKKENEEKKISEFKISISNNKSKSNMTKEKKQFSSIKKNSERNKENNNLFKKQNTGLLYKKKKMAKNKGNIIAEQCSSNNNKKEMNRYFSEDLFDVKSYNKYKMSYDTKITKSNPLKIKNLKIKIENDKINEKYGGILSNSNKYLNTVKNKNDKIDINNNEYEFEPFDLNGIYLKKKGQIKKEFIEKLEKKKIKYKKISNYSFFVEIKNDISFESEIKMNKNQGGNICVLKIKKIKGNNSTIFNCLKKIVL